MADKVYEMEDDHKRAAAFLVERIAERDDFAEKLKLLPPSARPEALHLLAEFDAAIERSEQSLAKEYETYQIYQRALDEQAQTGEKILETMAGVFIHFKYRHPDKLDEMNATVFNNWDADEREAFDDRVAILEATDLIKIIAVEGETREQTEEYLKNFRAAASE